MLALHCFVNAEVPAPAGVPALVLGGIFFVGLIWAALVSIREDETRAARVSALFALLVPLPYVAVGLLALSGRPAAAWVLIAVTIAMAAVLAWPVPVRRRTADTPTERIDERTIMFSRALYEPDSERFADYYTAYPDHRDPDVRFRAKPGLLQPGTLHHDPVLFAAANASFTAVEQFGGLVDGMVDDPVDGKPATTTPATSRADLDAADLTRFVKSWARKLGAVAVGVTEMRDYHYYTTVGRGPQWGEQVQREHSFGIVVAVEMDKAMLDRAPAGPAVMESAQQYLACGAIAVQLAELCRGLGWPTRAHIDGNYRVVCPLVARDAGLGEIGRMGLVMTGTLGPRVRLAVVTTDLPLIPDQPQRDPSTLDFCRICRKCAEVCPAQAISADDPRPIAGAERWQIDQEACYTYWCAVGTDCGRCVRVCPFSHPDSALHAVVRWTVRRNPWTRWLALRLDDLFYGRRPPPLPLEPWQRVAHR